ncbi:MAG TPA: hypothetical protein VEB43_15350 [Anaeromyxobacter sp.]|nr:hypothetical protein [Anaeromyxobacter sp.]
MRRTAIPVAALLLSSCATTPAPSPEVPSAAEAEPALPQAPPVVLRPVSVEFVNAEVTKAGAAINETRYSERPDDVAITAKIYAQGVITVLGNVGLGKGSSYGGIGLNFSVAGDGKSVDARGYKAVTFKLSSPVKRNLRLRIWGADRAKREGGCYPVYTQAVGPEMKAYTIPLAAFEAESWCGKKAEPVLATLGSLWGFEVADVTLSRDPTNFSIGTVTLEP